MNLFGEDIRTDLMRLHSQTGNLTAPNICYVGNKQGIVGQLVYTFPECEHFLDACCGGGSVGYSMLTYGRAKNITLNDIHKPLIDLHKALLSGEHDINFENPEWCSREQFFISQDRIKNGNYTVKDVLYAYVFGFGNDARTYAYSRELEPYKKSIHQTICGTTLNERKQGFAKCIRYLNKIENFNDTMTFRGIDNLKRLQNLENIKSLQSLQSLQSDCINFMNMDIYEIDYSPYDCVYFDIPYETKDTKLAYYGVSFDHAKFWDFFMSLPNLAYASSYKAPDFVPIIKEIDKRVTYSANNKNSMMQKGIEKVYTNKSKTLKN